MCESDTWHNNLRHLFFHCSAASLSGITSVKHVLNRFLRKTADTATNRSQLSTELGGEWGALSMGSSSSLVLLLLVV